MANNNLNSGVLFTNDKATEENKQPQYTGTANVDGKELRLSAWVNEAQSSGNKYLAIKFQAEQTQEQFGASKYGQGSTSKPQAAASKKDGLPF